MIEYCYFNNNNYSFFISEDTLKLTPYTFMQNNELWENDSIEEFYKQISTTEEYNIIDIGAQSGLYSLYAKYLPLSTFYSFEPYTPTFHLLNQNIELNNITNVKTYNMGLSNKKDKIILNTCSSHNGLHPVGKTPLRFNDIEPIEINVDTLDHLFYDKDISVHFIKIDTEGWEYNILLGGIKTIKKYKPVIQLEWNETNMKQCDVDQSQLNNLINELGYDKRKIINEELFIYPK
jgi:FkbM family methyltransferase